MKILAIGGSGWMGSAFAALALREGHHVTVLSRGNHPVPPGAEWVRCDRDLQADWGDLSWDGDPASRASSSLGGATRWDLVVDFIGLGQKRAVQMLGIDSRGIQNVFVSSDLIYSPRQAAYPLVENESRYQTRFFGGGKYQAEWLFESGSSRRHTTVLRAGYLYGPGRPLGCLPRHLDDESLTERIRAGESLGLAGGGHFFVQPLHIDDFCRVILSVAGRVDVRGRRFNVAGPEVMEARRFYEMVGDALGCRVRIEEEPIEPLIDQVPEWEQYLRHRWCSTLAMETAGLPRPRIALAAGLRTVLARPAR